MAHKIIDDTPWHEDIAQQNPNGWTLKVGSAAVARLDLDDGFVIHLDNGVNIVIDELFKLRIGDKLFPVYLTEQTDWATAGRLLHQVVQETLATPDGTLEVSFASGDSEERAIVVPSPAWRIRFPDGSLCYGLREGGIGMMPATVR